MKHLNKDTTRPGKAARVNERFDLNGVTSFGGANILFDYAEQIGLGLKLHEVCTKFEKAANATYPLFSSLLVLVFGRTLGLLRIAEFTRLENDPLLATKFGFAKLPDAKLLYKDLDRLTTEATKGLAEVARWLAARLIKKEKAVILDVDSTVETVYGSLEKAAVGYNPTKRGRASFHPQLGFDGITRTLLGAQLRSGNTTSRTNVLDFLKDLLGTLPLGTKGKATRADRGYRGEAVFSFLEEQSLPCVITKMTSPLLDWTPSITQTAKRSWRSLPVYFEPPPGRRPGGISQVSAGPAFQSAACDIQVKYRSYTSSPLASCSLAFVKTSEWLNQTSVVWDSSSASLNLRKISFSNLISSYFSGLITTISP